MFKAIIQILLFALVGLQPLGAQQGDKAGEEQKQPSFPVPPSPSLTPEEALKTFKLAPGFRIELVASEPLIEDPVAIAFGPDGRIWVVEMRGFMPNVDGTGEDQPVGRVVVLEDTDGDGKMDKRTVFADGLVMPRGIGLVRDGVLVAEPPKLWFMRDRDGDGKADEKVEVAKDYGNRMSPEHTANGLIQGLDNWIYSANHTVRYRSLEEDFAHEPTAFRGQWGIAQDDFGRLFFNSNEDQLRCDLAPSSYLLRNRNYRTPMGINWQVIKDQSVWPVRVNPGVNRGYRKGQLRADGTLATFTAACGPTIYRGDNFPPEFYGNAFVCEPAGNLVKRDILMEKDGVITARRAYEKSEFLASTDERFRPVNAYSAPDGTLYVVDMYRGVVQHRIFVTSYLRNQIKSRALEQPLHGGRIYRVVSDSKPRGPSPHLDKASSAELVNVLSNPNGWWRDTAQRLLVERSNPAVVPALEAKAASGSNILESIHALWTLEGMGALSRQTIIKSLTSPEPRIRATAIRLSEVFLKSGEKTELISNLVSLAQNDLDADTQLQAAFTLGQVADGDAVRGMLIIAKNSSSNVLVREALITGLEGRELEFLDKLFSDPDWIRNKPGREQLVNGLARCVIAGRKAEQVEKLLGMAASQPGDAQWRRLALLDGLAAAVPAKIEGKQTARYKPVRFEVEPEPIMALQRISDTKVRERMKRIGGLITWPGQPGYEPPVPVPPLTADQRTRFDEGKVLFEATCAQCHQPHGFGQEGLAPPLADSEWVLGSDRRLARIALQGAHGPIHVTGRVYDMDMPAFGGAMTDEQVAAILTYVRRSWEHGATPVEPGTVQKVRAETAKREEAWSEAELLKVP
ncbi:MAG: dehydrogenase [Pedosphaera sp.]|nr:dehydrogenase [Pedosphaera sp.]